MRSQTQLKRQIPYRELAEFRYQIRRFLNFSERAARAAGVEPQQHQALLAIKAVPGGQKATVGYLAERLQIEHHSAVELARRLEAKKLLQRSRNTADRRQVLLRLTPSGEKLLRRLSETHRSELGIAGPKLLRALETAVRQARDATSGRAQWPGGRRGRISKSRKRR